MYPADDALILPESGGITSGDILGFFIELLQLLTEY
jgi:hypothetical protein